MEQQQQQSNFRVALSEADADDKQAEEEEIEEMEDGSLVLSPLDPPTLAALLSRLPPPPPPPPPPHSMPILPQRQPSLAPPKSAHFLSTPFPPSPRHQPHHPIIHPLHLPHLHPLTITRFTPTSSFIDHPLSTLTLTFSQPMLPLSTVSDVQTQHHTNLPLTLTPEVQGQWRWIGTQTVQFEAKHRLPFSTTFTLSVAKHCKSCIGGDLCSPFSHTFCTSPPRVLQWSPSTTPDSLSPLFFLSFDQCISPSAAISHIKLTTDFPGHEFTSNDFQLLEEKSAEQEWPHYVTKENTGKWLAFKLKQTLRNATTYTLHVLPGFPSAEGPLTSTDGWSSSFSTYGPLVIESTHPHSPQPPGTSWTITFSNPLDHSTVTKQVVQLSPSIQDLRVVHTLSSRTITLEQHPQPETSYLVTFDTDVRDIFGQSLELSKNTASFQSGPYPALLRSLSGADGMIIMDPALLQNPFFSVTVRNYSSLRFQVYQVDVDDWSSAELPFHDKRRYAKGELPVKGKKVTDCVVEMKVERDQPHEHRIFLSPFLQYQEEHVGQLLVIVEPTERVWEECQGKWSNNLYESSRSIVSAWIQCTYLSVDIFPDNGNHSLTAWVTDLSTGAPVSQACVCVNDKKQDTGKDGLASLEVNDGYQKTVVVKKGNDTTFLTNVRFHNKYPQEDYRWHVFNDRGLYRPKEEVHIRGCIRKLEKRGEARLPVFAHGNVKYSVCDSRRNELTAGNTTLNDYGAFFFTFSIPDNANLGRAFLNLGYTREENKQHAGQYVHRFTIQEFRKPEYEVTSSYHPTTYRYSHPAQKDVVIVSTSAMYFAGGPLTGAEIRWIVYPKQTCYTPPGQSEFKFGRHRWGWMSMNRRNCKGVKRNAFDEDKEMTYPSFQLVGKTGMDGKHEVKIEYGGIEKYPCPITITAQASVIDLNNQAQETMTSFLVHPSCYYVGYKLKKLHVKKGEDVKGELIVSDVDGKLMSGVNVRLSVRGEGKEQKTDASGLLVYEDVWDEQEITLRSEEKAAVFSFVPNLGGSYSLIFSIVDPEQRGNQSSYHGLYVSGGYQEKNRVKLNFVSREHAQLIPNKDTYEVGETAELLVLSPFCPAEGLLIMKFDDTQVGEKMRFSMQSETHTISLALEIDWIPSLQVQVELVGSTLRAKDTGVLDAIQPSRPAFAVGNCTLKISFSTHRLILDITPKRAEEVTSPGQTIHTSVVVKEQANGKAVGGAEVGLIMVDESVLSLTGYTLDDPLPVFYPMRYSNLWSYHTRERCQLTSVKDVQEISDEMRRSARLGIVSGMRFGEMEKSKHPRALRHCARRIRRIDDEAAGPAIVLRSNFDPLAALIPFAITDEQGQLELLVKLPDNLTRYRIWAVAATERKFGIAESSLTVQLPVVIRPSVPRFLNFSDHPHVSVVLQNQTDQSLPLLVGVRAINATIDAAHSGYALTLPSAQRFAVTFPLTNISVGTSHLHFVVSTTEEKDVPLFSDASKVAIPVYSPFTSEAYATYGDVVEKEVISHPIRCPLHVYPQFGGLEVSTSSTAVQSLTDAFLYLYEYPYQCNEQLASRIIGMMSLWDALGAFNVKELPSVEKMKGKLDADMLTLKGRQISCGGWSWWTQGGNACDEPFISLHVACALVKASKKELLEVDVKMMRKAMDYCADIESHINKHPSNVFWSNVTKYALMAYALYVRTLYNEKVVQDASILLEQATTKHLTMEACGWMLVAFSSAKEDYKSSIKILVDHILSNVNETAEHANVTTSFEDDRAIVMLHSNRRTDAILLEAFLVIEPTSTLCTKLAKSLQAHRKAGRWNSTQENCFVLLALDRFFHVYEEQHPDFVANIWLGDQFASCHTYIGRSTEVNQVCVPMSTLLAETKEKDRETTELIIQRQGTGRLYYRIGLAYTPLNLQLEASSYGFTVSRSFEGVNSSSHAVHDCTTNVWKMKLGERVKVTLSVTTTAHRYHVALVDFLPAGCEVINPLLRGMLSSSKGNHSMYPCFSRLRWVEHENLRDERVEAFCSSLWPGVYDYSYVMRVTCKGEFVVPPSKVEEMYNPENFGRSATEMLVVY